MTQGKIIERMKKGRYKNAWKAKTPAKISWKQSCPLSVEINISWFSPNTYGTRMMKMKWGWTFQQDNDHKHSQGNSQLVSEKENKVARMAQPILNPVENKN